MDLNINLMKSDKLVSPPGDPQIVATDGTHIVIQRGKLHYGILEIGQSLKDVHRWQGKELLNSTLENPEYVSLENPEPYKETKLQA